MRKKHFILPGVLGAALFVFVFSATPAHGGYECAAGYVWDRMSGVGCVQVNCNSETIPNAHLSYESRCVCGSSGSITENLKDPNKECYLPADNKACPSCVYACVYLDEDCPNTIKTNSNAAQNRNVNINRTGNANANENATADQNANTAGNGNKNANTQSAGAPSLSTTLAAPAEPPSCAAECNKYLRGQPHAAVVSAEGVPPKCQCQVDVRNGAGLLTQTITTDGTIEVTLTFDPSTGELIKKTKFDRAAEVERVRQRLGYRYTEAQIDALLAPDKIDQWFQDQIKNIKTRTGLLEPQFWWQHLVAVLDHGFDGNSADFVDTHEFGRCGDSMQWLERRLAGQLSLNDDPDKPGQKHEAFLSITGEKYGNFLNHTSLIIRPPGFANSEWEDIVEELKARSGGLDDNPGIPPRQLDGIDPRLLDAKVLDPYKKEITTVREFIKGWSYIRIS